MKIKICAVIMVMIILFMVGYVVGASHGFDNGFKTALIQVGRSLEEGIKDGYVFYLQGIKVKFIPRKDGAVNIKKN